VVELFCEHFGGPVTFRRGRAMRKNLVLSALFLLLSTLSVLSYDSTADIDLFPFSEARFLPGTEVTVCWNTRPADLEEFEVLLYFDDLKFGKVRLTEQIDPSVSEVRWVVPNIPADSARIAIRYSSGGPELWGGDSLPFQIVPSGSFVYPSLEIREGEVWMGKGCSLSRNAFTFSRGNYRPGHPGIPIPECLAPENDSTFLANHSLLMGGEEIPESSTTRRPGSLWALSCSPVTIPSRE